MNHDEDLLPIPTSDTVMEIWHWQCYGSLRTRSYQQRPYQWLFKTARTHEWGSNKNSKKELKRNMHARVGEMYLDYTELNRIPPQHHLIGHHNNTKVSSGDYSFRRIWSIHQALRMIKQVPALSQYQPHRHPHLSLRQPHQFQSGMDHLTSHLSNCWRWIEYGHESSQNCGQ